jgi:hypothetical protein
MARAALKLHDQFPRSPAAKELADAAAAQARAAVAAAHCATSTAQDALYQHQGERGTRWFHRLDKASRPQQPIPALCVPGAFFFFFFFFGGTLQG